MKRTSYEDKATKGTARLEKNQAKDLNYTSKVPPAQPYLTTAGKRIYTAICKHLIKNQLLHEIDSYYASSIAHNLDLYSRLAKQIEEKEKLLPGSGYFQTFPNGVQQNSPQFNTMNKAFDTFEKGCRNLGMTAKGRDSILGFSTVKGEEGDPEDEFNLKGAGKKAPSDGRPSAAGDR